VRSPPLPEREPLLARGLEDDERPERLLDERMTRSCATIRSWSSGCPKTCRPKGGCRTICRPRTCGHARGLGLAVLGPLLVDGPRGDLLGTALLAALLVAFLDVLVLAFTLCCWNLLAWGLLVRAVRFAGPSFRPCRGRAL
jgi:hypothetical protein